MLQNLIVCIEDVPTDDINSLLGWVIGVLVAFATALLVYLRYENTKRMDDFKLQITDLKAQLKSEIDYNKAQDNANIKLITDTGNILNAVLKNSESEINVVNEVKAINEGIKTRVDDIHAHLMKNK
jgi:gas vesicle protein|tara:strand:+ start:39611 stop:39988 length:378 start_codon:yes stop_codon:yes gene_type:complete